jgi:hypothetical protein
MKFEAKDDFGNHHHCRKQQDAARVFSAAEKSSVKS